MRRNCINTFVNLTVIATLLLVVETGAARENCGILDSEYAHKREGDAFMKGVYKFYWTLSLRDLSVGITAKTPGWVAFGVGSPTSSAGMIGAEAILGWYNETEVFHNVRLDGYKPSAFVDTSQEVTMTNTSVCHTDDGWTVVKFTRAVHGGRNPISLDPSKPTPLVFAMSPNTGLVRHRGVLSVDIDLVNDSPANEKPPKPLNPSRLAHAILMTVAWGAILPIGVLFPRFGRDKGGALWFKLHRLFQVGGWIVAVAAFLVILIQHIVVGDNHFNNPHEKMGLAVMILGGLQFVFGFIRPDPPSTSSPTKSGLRVSWEFFHRWVGRGTLVVAFVTIFTGLDKMKAALIFTILFSVWLGVGGLVYLGLELRQKLRLTNNKHEYIAIANGHVNKN